jgi:hypothetical protein
MEMSENKSKLFGVGRKDTPGRAKSPKTPQNWWGTEIPSERLIKIAEEDGIPVAWVPSPDLLIKLHSASNREERLTVLCNKQEKVLNHCKTLLTECTDQWISGERYLVDCSLSALLDGHHEAALALAVSIGEPMAVWASEPRVKAFNSEEDAEAWNKLRKKLGKYRWAKHEIENEPLESRRVDLIHRALIAPIPSFFRPFRLENGDEIPKQLSRHAVVHTAKKEQFSLENAILGLMLVSSILYQMQLWCNEVRSMEMEY